MDADLRNAAETRLLAAAEACGLSDPRPAYRDRLRMLRQRDPAAFDTAIEHYESRALPALANSDPLVAWLDYGNFLAGLTGDARLTIIDATGRARAFEPPLPKGSLALFVPDDSAVPALVAATPVEPSASQQAALALLVPRSSGEAGHAP